MQVSTALKIAAGVAAVGAVAVLAGCATKTSGPFAGVTNSLMDSLKPGNRGVLELSKDSVREI
ncbi:MAG: hypothetical protein H7287_02190, partial [Thermoleophilia bacterium]|nr:hypothetical protein [Thermoleophilia bacterium]